MSQSRCGVRFCSCFSPADAFDFPVKPQIEDSARGPADAQTGTAKLGRGWCAKVLAALEQAAASKTAAHWSRTHIGCVPSQRVSAESPQFEVADVIALSEVLGFSRFSVRFSVRIAGRLCVLVYPTMPCFRRLFFWANFIDKTLVVTNNTTIKSKPQHSVCL